MNKKKGQIAVIIALSMTFLFLLFAMVTNITYLVTAKINLQNAVDLAAYAGAAQQARYLTEIGKWNYEMRRNYKAFVYDYVISFNSERGKDFNDYIKYYNRVTPAVALSLSRRENTNSQDTKSFFNTTSFSLTGDAARAELQLLQAAMQVVRPITPGVSSGIINLINQILSQSAFDKNIVKNYGNNMHNYNSRILNWTVFDYRNLQARIRGSNFTKLDFNVKENRLLSNSRDSTGSKFFNNAPISVAAKVINSYINLDTAPNYTNNVLEINESSASNPMHNASYYTFKKNLLNIFDEAKLFYLKAKGPVPLGNNPSGDFGCSNNCSEFTGPNLKLDSHDGSFYADFMTIKTEANDQKVYSAMKRIAMGDKIVKSINNNMQVHPYIIDKFPIGVAKDARIQTYYTIIGIANTNNIPFNVFFGEEEETYKFPLIAVSAAKPYGSRIGPYIDNKCNSFKNPRNIDCKNNGLDPRYPQDKENGLFDLDSNDNTVVDFLYPDFSTNNNNNNNLELVNGGVKGTIIDKELLLDVNFQNNPSFLRLFTMGYNKKARNREPRDLVYDDGFCNSTNPTCNLTNNAGSPPYIENAKIHPQHHRNSIIAWHNNPNIDPPQASFEDYLYKLVGKAIFRFDDLRDNDFRVYIFKYPKLGNKYWNIGGLVQENSNTAQNSMEFSFANTMAVNEFEIYRYIIPSKNNSDNVLNWYGISKGQVFKGLKNYDTRKDLDNIAVFDNNLILDEQNDVLKDDNSMETYTAWRTGIRGYKVKLVNINELIESSEFVNTLESTYTIKGFEDESIVVDLSKIAY